MADSEIPCTEEQDATDLNGQENGSTPEIELIIKVWKNVSLGSYIKDKWYVFYC